ncbi:rho guanine nucleotide exchange factor 28-like, partial [Erinaceus europaeus]|uniref:Rho guanine nucleotide exchange factor 28-like n=1 Tax=Erinaceus europaeus TaxID=9365 RepID=A0ABM3WVC4_ERIEU
SRSLLRGKGPAGRRCVTCPLCLSVCLCLDGVFPALVPEGAAGRGCWHVEPGTQGGDSAAYDSGEEVDGSTCPVSCQSEVAQAIQNLTRLLYSLQAALTIQDTHIEVHKLVLQQQEDPAPGPAFRGSPLQDQEKLRSTEGQREEPADVHRLQHQFQQDQRRWHRMCDQQQRQQEARAGRLQERERQCRSQEELLLRRRGQLDQQRQEHQQNLERLREGRRLVESERGRLRAQRDLLTGGWKHSRQSSLPAAFAPGSQEVMDLNRSESLCQDHSAVISEDLAQLSLHTPHRATPAGVPQDATYPPSMPASALGRTSEHPVDLATGVSQPSDVNRQLWAGAGSCHRVLPSHQSRNDLDPFQTEFQPADDASPHRPHLQLSTASTRLNVQVTGPEGETGAGAGENIVYL